MADLTTLTIEADKAATWRGHRLQWGAPYHGEHNSIHEGTCTHAGCEAWVQVMTTPPANGIDIVGPAVAVNCPYTEP